VLRLNRPRMAVRALQVGLTSDLVTADTCDRATFFVFRTTDAYHSAVLSRLVLADASPRIRIRPHGLSVPAYPPSLFPFHASFSALGLTCSAQGVEDEELKTAIGDLTCRRNEMYKVSCIRRHAHPSLDSLRVCLSCIGTTVLLPSYRRTG
jgi:hypothetical protein